MMKSLRVGLVCVVLLGGMSSSLHADQKPDAKAAMEARKKAHLSFEKQERQKRWDFDDKEMADRRQFEDQQKKERRELDLKMESELENSTDLHATHESIHKQRQEFEKSEREKREEHHKKMDAERKAFHEQMEADRKQFMESQKGK